jgi:hypothetical protein
LVDCVNSERDDLRYYKINFNSGVLDAALLNRAFKTQFGNHACKISKYKDAADLAAYKEVLRGIKQVFKQIKALLKDGAQLE